MIAAELLVACLENEGVEFLFALPGEENLDVLDALANARIRVILVRHEQGAAFLADVADANLDRVPLVAITGQASLDRTHKESHQYIDVMALFKPVTKWQAQIARASIIPEAVRKAFKVAQTEKPGATHLELPEDVAATPVGEGADETPLHVQAPFVPEPLSAQVKRAIQAIQSARRPLILAGNGVVRRRGHEAVRRFARTLNIPVVHTFMGKGIMPDSDPLSLYTIGLRLRDYPALAMEQADVVIAVGYDFVEYAPCYSNPNRDKRVVHIDVSPAEVDAHYIVEVGVLGDLALSLEQIGDGLSPFEPDWAKRERERIVAGFEGERAGRPTWPMRPQNLVAEVRAALAPEDLVVCDVGAHKLWMGRMFPCEVPNTCLLSNGFASMGIGLPGAIAAKLAFPERRVLTACGDGGFLMNVQELETAVRLRVPVVALVWRDDGYGVIRWNQLVRFGRTMSVDFGNPDLVALAQSFGAVGLRVSHPDELRPCLAEAFRSERPVVIDCPVDYAENLRLTEFLTARG